MSNSTHGVERAVHGALDYGELERLGLHPAEVLDFSVNANPYGPSPRVREAVVNAAIDRYPDRECLELRRAMLDYELTTTDLPPSSIVCGNGTAELIWAIARAYLKPGLKTAIIGPTFGEYRVASLATVPGLALQPEQPDRHLVRPAARRSSSGSLPKDWRNARSR